MAERDDTLLAQIERDALDDACPLSQALRKCVVLGGKAKSRELREWATKELEGYGDDDALPPYRYVHGPLCVNAMTFNAQITGQTIDESALPEGVRKAFGNGIGLRMNLAEIEDMAASARASGEAVQLSFARAAAVASYMNAQVDDPYQNITAVYWKISGATMHGVVDRVRTTLAQLVGELRATMPPGQEVPSAELAANAVSVAVTGKRAKVTVATAQASEESQATIAPPAESGFWTRDRTIGAAVTGAATIVGAIAAVIALF